LDWDRCSLMWITPGRGTAQLQRQMFLHLEPGKLSAPLSSMEDDKLRMQLSTQ
jgi:hypothetical protein